MVAVSLLAFSALMADGFVPSPALSQTTNTNRNSRNPLVVSLLSEYTGGILPTALFSTTATPTSDAKAQVPQQESKVDAVICGGGPAGLLTAIMLIQKFPNQKVKLYDRLPKPFSPTDETVWNDVAKFYLIGLGGRGQCALDKFGVWDPVRDVCTAVVGRKDWAPESEEGVERIFEGRKFKTEVLPRDKLVAVLYQHIVENYSSDQIELNHGYEVVPVTDNTKGSALVDIFKCQGDQESDVECQLEATERISTNLLIAADGTARTVANYMEETDRNERKSMNPIKRMFAGKPFSVTRYEDDNRRIYKTIPMKLPEDWRPDLNYSARSQKGGMNIDALPANRKGDYCGVLLLKEDDPMAQADVDPKELRGFLDKLLPQFSAFLDDDVLALVAKKPPSFLPSFRYVGPRLNQGDHTLILGDCAHTVKPYFGLGANSALEDVAIFSDCIDDANNNMAEAVHEFSKRRAKDSETLVRISRDLDRPGVIGAFSFIIPLIMDSIFNKINPKLFAPNIISMLQRDDMTFNQVARRKRIDRIAQLTIIGSFFSGAAWTAKKVIFAVAEALGRRPLTVAGTLAVTISGVLFSKKAFKIINPEMAPADVLAKMKTPITEQKEMTTEDSASSVA